MNYWELSQLRGMLLWCLLIGAMVTVIITPWILKARERRRIHETLDRALDRGVVPPPELLKALTDNAQPEPPARSRAQRDLRKGILWLSVALGIAAFGVGLVIGHDPREIELPIREPLGALAIAGLPAAVGLGYIILWLVGRKDPLQ